MSKLLDGWGKKYQEPSVSDEELNQAIDSGFNKAKQHRKHKQWSVGTLMTAAIFFLSMITLVNVLPTFAQQLEQLPGMEKIISLVQFNKGQQSAIENEYYQSIDISKQEGAFTFTVDGVIRDQSGLVIFYTITSEEEWEQLKLEEIEVLSTNGKELTEYTMAYFSPGEERSKTFSGTVEIFSAQPIPYETFKMITHVSVDDNQLQEKIEIEFETGNSKEALYYTIAETVEVAGQKIYVESVTIHPLRVEVKLQADPENDMEIFSIVDLALVDSDGEIWSGITGGVTASGEIEEDNYKAYLQSNYFESPESLTLTFSKVEAVQRGMNYLRVDLENEEILHDPYGAFGHIKYEDGWLSVSMPLLDFVSYPLGQAYDLKGNEIALQAGDMSAVKQTENQRMFEKKIDTDETVIDIQLVSYPNWIEQKVEIPLK